MATHVTNSIHHGKQYISYELMQCQLSQYTKKSQIGLSNDRTLTTGISYPAPTSIFDTGRIIYLPAPMHRSKISKWRVYNHQESLKRFNHQLLFNISFHRKQKSQFILMSMFVHKLWAKHISSGTVERMGDRKKCEQ